MKPGHAGTALDMYFRVFPDDPYVLAFEPTNEQVSAMTAHTAKYAADDAEQEALLRMLGIIPTESATAVAIRENRERGEYCRNGHKRSEWSIRRSNGFMRCQECAAELDEKRGKELAA